MKGKYVYSLSDDDFDTSSGEYDTLEEALNAARRWEDEEYLVSSKHTEVYIGVMGEDWQPEINGEGIIDMLRENAYEDCGAEDYLDNITNDQVNDLTKELTAAFNRWAQKYGHTADFAPVENVQEYKL